MKKEKKTCVEALGLATQNEINGIWSGENWPKL
jgi:hypothetical protein